MGLATRIFFIAITTFSIMTYLVIPHSGGSLKEDLENWKIRLEAFLPETTEQLESRFDTLRDLIKDTSQFITDNNLSKKNAFRGVIQPWIGLGQELLENLSSLSCLPTLFSEDPDWMEAFSKGLYTLEASLKQKVMQAQPLIVAIETFLETGKLENLTPYERYCLLQLVTRLYHDPLVYSFAKEKQQLFVLMEKIKGLKLQNFEYRMGEALSITQKPKELKVFTLNTCFMPGELSYFFGGMPKWEERIKGVVLKIQEEDPDVLCLQEVHSEKAGEVLFESLKKTYAHFYFNMGPQILSSSLQDLGLNSGLFVASKYPITDTYFEVFQVAGKQQNVNKGFFFFSVVDGQGSAFAHIITCHLEPFNQPQCPSIREKELFEIINYTFAKNTPKKNPVLLCGDLNIPWGIYEPGQYVLEEYFYDAFNTRNKQKFPTCSDYFLKTLQALTKQEKGKIRSSLEILDYALLLKKEGFSLDSIDTYVVEFFDIKHPSKALSDHNALMTRLKLL